MLNFLKKIEAKLASYGEKLPQGIDEHAAALFVEESKKELNWNPNPEYLSFVSHVDGLDYDGIIFSKIANVIEENLDYQKNDPDFFKTYVLLGSDNDTKIVFNKIKNTYCLLDEPSYDLIDSFDSLEDLLGSILKGRL